jgi:exodeoxyribonuclease VII large subunit
MRLTPDSAALMEQLSARANQLRRALTRSVREEAGRAGNARRALAAGATTLVRRDRHRLDLAAAALERLRPTAVLAARRTTVEALAERLARGVRARVSGVNLPVLAGRLRRAASGVTAQGSQRLASLARHLHSVGPASVLDRGFSYTRREDGRLVRAPSDVRPGDRVVTTVAHGSFGSIVEGAPGKKPPRTRPQQPDTTGLFGTAP